MGSRVRGRVNARKIRSVLQVGASVGLDVTGWMALHGLSDEVLSEPDGLLPQTLWRDAWTAVVAHSGNAAVGLRAAASIPRGYYGVIDYVIRSQPTLGEGVRAAVRYFPLANTTGVIELRRSGSQVVASRLIRGDEQGQLPLQAAEFALLSMVRTLKLAVAQPWSPTEVRFRHARTEHAHETERHFGCPVRYQAAEDAITVEASVLALPTVGADAELLAIVTRHAEDRLQSLSLDDDFEAHVRHAIRVDLEGGGSGIDTVARRLGQSRRTLQRRLSERDLVFRDLQREVRSQVADGLLVGSELSIGEVAWLTGYSDASTFCRAYRGWFGVSPSERRRQKA